jgi:hypothetical protein
MITFTHSEIKLQWTHIRCIQSFIEGSDPRFGVVCAADVGTRQSCDTLTRECGLDFLLFFETLKETAIAIPSQATRGPLFLLLRA